MTFAERRRHPRFRLFKNAKIVFGTRGHIADCIIRNWSESGACLMLTTAATLPAEFQLTFDGRNALRYCSVAWRFDNRLGVMFQPVMFQPPRPVAVESSSESDLAGEIT